MKYVTKNNDKFYRLLNCIRYRLLNSTRTINNLVDHKVQCLVYHPADVQFCVPSFCKAY